MTPKPDHRDWEECPACLGVGQPDGDGSGWDGGGNYHTPACELCGGRGEVPVASDEEGAK